MPNNKKPKDVNDLLMGGVDPLSLPAEDWPAEETDRPAAPASETPAGSAEKVSGKGLSWQGEAAEWWAEDAPEREWLVRAGAAENAAGFLPRGEVCMLAGRGAAGKTWALVALAVAVASGRPWLGYRTEPKSGRVAFLAGEEEGHELRRRFQAQAAMMGVDPSGLAGSVLVLDRRGVATFPGGPSLVLADKTGRAWSPSPFGSALLSDLASRAEEGRFGWDLVVVDPLSAFGSPDSEIDNAAATATMREIEKLCELPGAPSVLVAHHVKKADRSERGRGLEPDQDDIRGASGIVNRVRWAAVLEKVVIPEEKQGRAGALRFGKVAVVKGNYAPLGETLLYVQPPALPSERGGGPARGAIRATIGDEAELTKKGKTGNPEQPRTTTSKASGKKGGIDGSNV